MESVFINGDFAGFCTRIVNSKSYDEYGEAEYSYNIEGFIPVTEEEDTE